MGQLHTKTTIYKAIWNDTERNEQFHIMWHTFEKQAKSVRKQKHVNFKNSRIPLNKTFDTRMTSFDRIHMQNAWYFM